MQRGNRPLHWSVVGLADDVLVTDWASEFVTILESMDERNTAVLAITRIRRVFYKIGSSVDRTAGPLELSFSDGSVVWLDAGADGESLHTEPREWVDPFSPPLSQENEEFVRASGKWTVIDVSSELPYSALVGAPVERTTCISAPDGRTIGMEWRVADKTLRATVGADELFVTVS